MRIGLNPNKNNTVKDSQYVHQVIIPVYIPHEEEYFKDAFKIFKMCLQSLLKTSHAHTFITVVNNGSCRQVTAYLDALLQEQQIQEVIHTENIGKINAVIKGLVGHNMPLVTIADADVLFLSGWQTATSKIFNTFPKTGVVGLTPQFKSYENFCGNVILENLFSEKLQYTKVKDPRALQKFYESIGWDTSYNQDYLKRNLTITKNGCRAVVGSGHYVATYRRALFNTVTSFQNIKLGVDSERQLDIIPLHKGLWRLTTNANFAYHMGNVKEDWMDAVLNSLRQEPLACNEVSLGSQAQENRMAYFIKNRLFPKIFSYRFTKQFFYILKGLPKEMRSEF